MKVIKNQTLRKSKNCHTLQRIFIIMLSEQEMTLPRRTLLDTAKEICKTSNPEVGSFPDWLPEYKRTKNKLRIIYTFAKPIFDECRNYKKGETNGSNSQLKRRSRTARSGKKETGRTYTQQKLEGF